MFVSGGTLVTKTPLGPSLSDPSSSWFPYMPGMSSTSWPSAYGAMYREQLWIYVVVNKLAAGTARLPLPVYERNELDRPKADNHPMSRLLRRPNPGLTSFALWEWTSCTFDVFGEAFWLKRRTRGEVTGLYPLHPSLMVRNGDGSWDFRNGDAAMSGIAPTDLVHFMHYNPDSTSRGLSPLEPLRQTLENEWHARTATSSFWRNGARPGMALSHPKTLSEAAQQRLKAQVDASVGGAGRTGSTLVLEEGMEPKVMTLSAEEAQYIDTRKLNREEVCGALDVPPPAVHILDHATFSNITEQMRSVYRDTQAPRLRRFEATIDLDLRQAEWPSDDVYAEFLMDEVLRGDFEARQEALAKASHMTIAEKRKIENLPFIDGTDRIFLNSAEQPMAAPQTDDAPAAPPFQQVGLPDLVEAGVISREDARKLLGIDGPPPALPVLEEAPPAVPGPRVPLEVVRSVMGRLAWQKSLDEVDPGRLSEDLPADTAVLVVKALDDVRAESGSVRDLRDRLRLMASTEE